LLLVPNKKDYWESRVISLVEQPLPCRRVESAEMHDISPAIAIGVFLSTAATDAVYVLFNAAVAARRRVGAASWSSLWYLLSAFAVISYTKNPAYVIIAAAGSWLGAFLSVSYLDRTPRLRQ
jgi:hypothetical protein